MSYDRFLTSDEIITIPAKFSDGTESPTYWKRCAHFHYERWKAAENSKNPAEVERAKQRFIAASLVNQDGTPAMSEKDSIKLTSEGVLVLFPLVLEANGIVSRPDPKAHSSADQQDTSSDT